MQNRTTKTKRHAHVGKKSLIVILGLALSIVIAGCQQYGESKPATQAASAHSIGVVLDPASPRAKLLKKLSLHTVACPDTMTAISGGKYGVVIADAIPSALKALAANPQALKTYTDNGGWLMLWGLTPDGLADFNRLVGVEHLIRPFMVEAVSLPKIADPLLSGASPFDVLMLGGFGIQNIPLRAGDVWSYVLDGNDIAPFATIPPSSYWRPGEVTAPGSDHYPPNLVNGLDDNWQLGFTIPTDKPEYLKWTFAFPRPETVTRFSLIPDSNYKKITRIRLSFPGSTAEPRIFDVNPGTMLYRQDFAIPDIQANGVTLEILDMLDPQGITGIRNLWIQVKRTDDFNRKVHPLLSIGVLNKYPMGQGGIIVNEMNSSSDESADNRQKQATLLGVLLRNLLTPPAPVAVPVRQEPPKISDGPAVNVDAFRQADESDDTEAVRRAINYAIKNKLTHVVFSAGTYYLNTAIQVQGADNLTLQGTLDANGRPATILMFIMPTRINGASTVPILITGVNFQNFFLRY